MGLEKGEEDKGRKWGGGGEINEVRERGWLGQYTIRSQPLPRTEVDTDGYVGGGTIKEGDMRAGDEVMDTKKEEASRRDTWGQEKWWWIRRRRGHRGGTHEGRIRGHGYIEGGDIKEGDMRAGYVVMDTKREGASRRDTWGQKWCRIHRRRGHQGRIHMTGSVV